MVFGGRSNPTAHTENVVQMDRRPIPPNGTMRNIVRGGCEVHSCTVRSRSVMLGGGAPGQQPFSVIPALNRRSTRAFLDMETLIGPNFLERVHGSGGPSDRQLIHFPPLSEPQVHPVG